MKKLLLAIFLVLIGFITLQYYLSTPYNIKIVNFTEKSERIIYCGSVENVKIIYSSLKNDYDVVKIIIHDNKKNEIFNRLYYRENIKIIIF